MKGCLSAEGGRKAVGSGGFGIAILLRYFSMDGIKFPTNLAYGSIESRNTTLHSREHLLGCTSILPQHLQHLEIDTLDRRRSEKVYQIHHRGWLEY